MLIACLLAGAAATVAPAPFKTIQPYLVGISVSNVEVSQKWYESVLGFESYRRMDLPNHGVRIAFLKAGAFRLELVEKAGAQPLKAYAPALKDNVMLLGLMKLAFVIPDLDAAVAELRHQSVRFVVEPFDDPPMKLRSCIVADPDGNLVQLMQEVE